MSVISRPEDMFNRAWEWDALVRFCTATTAGATLGVVSGRRRQGIFSPGAAAVKSRFTRSGIGPGSPGTVVVGRHGLGWQATRSCSRISSRTSFTDELRATERDGTAVCINLNHLYHGT